MSSKYSHNSNSIFWIKQKLDRYELIMHNCCKVPFLSYVIQLLASFMEMCQLTRFVVNLTFLHPELRDQGTKRHFSLHCLIVVPYIRDYMSPSCKSQSYSFPSSFPPSVKTPKKVALKFDSFKTPKIP